MSSAKKVVKKSTRTSSKKVVKLQDFTPLLRDGLSSHKSYVVLKQKHRSPVYLAFKPFVARMSSLVVYIGGKLSAFPNASHEAWANIAYDGKTEVLRKAFKSLPNDRVSGERVGSHAGIYVSAGAKDLKKLLTKVEVKKVVKGLLDSIQKKLDIEIENRTDVTKFLTLTFTQQMAQSAFNDGYGQSLPTRQIGKTSQVLFGQNMVGGSGTALGEFVNEFHLKAVEAQAA